MCVVYHDMLALQIQRLSLTCCQGQQVVKICWRQVLRTPAAWFLCYPKDTRISLEVNELCVSWEIKSYAGFVWVLNGNSCIPSWENTSLPWMSQKPTGLMNKVFSIRKLPMMGKEESQKMSKQKVSKEQQQQQKPKWYHFEEQVWYGKIAWVLLTHTYTLIFSLSSLWGDNATHSHGSSVMALTQPLSELERSARFYRHLVLSKTSVRHLVYTKCRHLVLSKSIWHGPNMLMDVLGRTNF